LKHGGLSISKLTVRRILAAVLRYGLAVVLVAIAIAFQLSRTSTIHRLDSFPTSSCWHSRSLFWCAGRGPGVLALLLSCLGVALLAANHFLLRIPADLVHDLFPDFSAC